MQLLWLDVTDDDGHPQTPTESPHLHGPGSHTEVDTDTQEVVPSVFSDGPQNQMTDPLPLLRLLEPGVPEVPKRLQRTSGSGVPLSSVSDVL